MSLQSPWWRVRLIPAHAGKTTPRHATTSVARAHPRSRGENVRVGANRFNGPGSSPLTRGKHDPERAVLVEHGLIPAHAGKTRLSPLAASTAGAHPRSRGENGMSRGVLLFVAGSSPLTRGKRSRQECRRHSGGLIPAHAGKTGSAGKTQCPRPAHPRSRGENLWPSVSVTIHPGSSPLTRGKPDQRRGHALGAGLIPAHAGKTLSDLRFYQADRSDLGKP